jgi:CubicO group peptidase (beta-lactamase class C family)
MNVRLLVAVGGVLGLVVGLALRPGQPRLPDESHGSSALAATMRDLTDARPHAVAAAVVTRDGIETAVIGAPPGATFEIGSVSKGITGLLYADAVDRGEVSPDTRLGDVLELGDAEAADVTLGELAQHRSGLPRLPSSPTVMARTLWSVVAARNPYGETSAELLDQLRSVSVGDKDPTYSNLGFEALGLALATAAGTTYAELVRDRVGAPLQLTTLSVPASEDELGDAAVQGRDGSGRRQQAWTGEALGPAGGIRADVRDMATVVGALLDGSAPGVAATEPSATFRDDARIGAAWITTRERGRTITWHDGGTGGFRSWVGFDRESGVGVVVLAATSESVDAAGLALLDRYAGSREERS